MAQLAWIIYIEIHKMILMKYLKKIKMAKRGSIKRPPIKIEKSVSENESD